VDTGEFDRMQTSEQAPTLPPKTYLAPNSYSESVRIRKQGQPQGGHYVTVSNHCFHISTQENGHTVSKYNGKVWHPDEVKLGDYFEIDGMASSCMTVLMRAISITEMLLNRVHTFENYSLSMGMSNAIMAEGMCGASIVRVPDHDGEGGRGVLGFFHLGHDDSTWAATESIDNLINDSWKIIQEDLPMAEEAASKEETRTSGKKKSKKDKRKSKKDKKRKTPLVREDEEENSMGQPAGSKMPAELQSGERDIV
jgi:hypothetical protein